MVCLFLSQSQDVFFCCLNCLRARSSFSQSVSWVMVNVEYKYRYKLPFVLIRWYENNRKMVSVLDLLFQSFLRVWSWSVSCISVMNHANISLTATESTYQGWGQIFLSNGTEVKKYRCENSQWAANPLSITLFLKGGRTVIHKKHLPNGTQAWMRKMRVN